MAADRRSIMLNKKLVPGYANGLYIYFLSKFIFHLCVIFSGTILKEQN